MSFDPSKLIKPDKSFEEMTHEEKNHWRAVNHDELMKDPEYAEMHEFREVVRLVENAPEPKTGMPRWLWIIVFVAGLGIIRTWFH